MNEMKKTVISAVAVLVVVLAASGWTYMGWRKCRQAETALEQKKTQVAQLREKIARIPELRQEKTKLQEELAEYETILPNDRDLNNIFDTLSSFTKDSGVTILEFKPERERQDRPGESSSYKQVSYDLKLEGDFFQVIKFINLLENHKRFVRIDSLEMGKRDLDEPLGETSIQISTFVYDPKAEVAPRKRLAAAAKPAAARGASKAKAKAAPDTIPFVLTEERAKQFVVLAGGTSTLVRDPFSNPLTKSHPETPDPKLVAGGPKRMTIAPDQEQDFVKTLQEQMTAISEFLKNGDFEKAADTYADVQGKLAYQFKDPTLDAQVSALRTRAAEVGEVLKAGRGKRLYELVSEQYEKMKEAFAVGDYETVTKISLAQAEMFKKAGGVSYEGLSDLTRDVQQLSDRAKICAEFVQLDIKVQGTIRSQSGRAAAIINGQNLIEGDKLKLNTSTVKTGKKPAPDADVDTDVFVHAIAPDRITFRYKGERIDKLLVK